jgi:hypothetical protein
VPPAPIAKVAHEDIAAHFDPALVGALTPRPVEAGLYGVAIDVAFDVFPFAATEYKASLHAAMKLVLAPDGAAHACVATHEVDGGAYPQTAFHQHASRSVVAFHGRWSVVGGVAQIGFTSAASDTHGCDPTKPDTDELAEATRAALHCVATGATDKLPGDAIACTATDLAQIAMPMSRAERTPSILRPRGGELVLSRSGLHVEVEQLSAALPTFSYAPVVVEIGEQYYRHRYMF